MKLSAIRPTPLNRSLVGTVVLSVPLVVVVVTVGNFLGDLGTQLTLNFLVAAVGVVGFQIYSGNSGIMTFGHVGFNAVAAYSTGLMTVPIAIKTTMLPAAPNWAINLQSDPLLGILVGVIVAVCVSLIFGIPFAKLSTSVTPIATFVMLLIIHSVIVASAPLTRGSQTFYGLPRYVTVPFALGALVVVLFVARLFRESVFGLRLQASREDEMAAQSTGVATARLRSFAWIVSAAVCGLAGSLLALQLAAFSPRQFYIALQFMLVAMLVVGGQATVTGALVGSMAISVVLELARNMESVVNGLTVGPVTFSGVFGLQQMALAAAILGVMIWRRNGLFDFDELDDRLGLWPTSVPDYESRDSSDALLAHPDGSRRTEEV